MGMKDARFIAASETGYRRLESPSELRPGERLVTYDEMLDEVTETVMVALVRKVAEA